MTSTVSKPTAGVYPRRFNKREAKVIETAVASVASETQTLTNKTIDGDDNTVQDLPVTALKTVAANADKVLAGTTTTGVPVFKKVGEENLDCTAGTAGQVLQSDGAGNISFGDAVMLQSVADVTVSSAELLALNATPKVLLAAPAAGKAHLIHSVEFFLDFATTAYDGIAAGEDLIVAADTGTIMTIETTGFLDAIADARRYAAGFSLSVVPVAEDIFLQMTSGEIATGDSPLKVRIRYQTIDVIA